ncbi:MAG: DUF4129 domain-containing transglutaminase family protein [Vulcanimicrobiota bacterium]
MLAAPVNRLRGPEMIMALVAALTFAVVAEGWRWLTLALALLVVASWWTPWRYHTTPARQRLIFSLAGLPFLMAGLYHLSTGREAIITAQRVAVLGAVYVFVGAVIELYREPGLARAGVFHVGCLTLLMLGGLSYLNPYYPLSLLAYATAVVFFLQHPFPGMEGELAPTRSRAPVAGIWLALVLAFALSYWSFRQLPRLGASVYRAYARTLVSDVRPATGFFGATTELSDIQDLAGSRQVLARVNGPQTLLRGQIYTVYRGGRWANPSTRETREIMKSDQAEYQLPGPPPEPMLEWRIAPVKTAAGALNAPPGVYRLAIQVDELEIDAYDGLVADNQYPYTVWASGSLGLGRSPRRLDPTHREYVDFPPGLKNALTEAARAQLEPGMTPRQQALALENWLSEQGRYQPDAERPRGVDPIAHFLSHGLAGHCEFFASSMALILRSQGIPSRYVVGFKLYERNPWGDYWVVRDRDAHAWVEVYLEGEGWVTYDPTPPGEQAATHPEGDRTSGLDALWDGLKARLSGAWRWLMERSWGRVGAALGGLTLLTLLVGGGWWLRRYGPQLLASSHPTHELQPLLLRLDRHLARSGQERRPLETPLELAERLDPLVPEAAAWLRAYSQARFGPPDPVRIAELEQGLSRLLR